MVVLPFDIDFRDGGYRTTLPIAASAGTVWEIVIQRSHDAFNAASKTERKDVRRPRREHPLLLFGSGSEGLGGRSNLGL